MKLPFMKNTNPTPTPTPEEELPSITDPNEEIKQKEFTMSPSELHTS